MKWISSEQKLFYTSEVRKTCDKYHHFFPAANCGKEKCISVHFLWENIHMLTFPPLKIGFQKSLILAIVADIVDSIAPLSASRCILYLLYIVYFVFLSLRPFSPGIHSTKLFHFRSPSHPAITNPTIFSQKTSSPMENSLTSVWNLNVVIFLAQG